MSVGGSGRTRAHRLGPQDWIAYNRQLSKRQGRPLTEQQYVKALYRLRKDALSAGDERYIARLNDTLPPDESKAAS